MKHKFFLVVAALLIPWFPVEVHAAEPIRLRILCYNIHHAEGVDRKLDVERIASVIRSVEPDLVALQEVDQKVMRTQVVDQPAELAKLSRYFRAVFSSMPVFIAAQYSDMPPANNPRHFNTCRS